MKKDSLREKFTSCLQELCLKHTEEFAQTLKQLSGIFHFVLILAVPVAVFHLT